MRVRTLESLEELLDRAFAWRKKELTNLSTAVKEARGHLKPLFLRAGVALLYAHWEGFVKNAAEGYIELVAEQRHLCGELASNFVVLSINRILSDVDQSRKTSFRVALVDFIRNEAAQPSRVLARPVDTRSNLNSEALRDIVDLLGLDYSPYELKAKLIDESLLATRNRVAHGEFGGMDESRYLNLATEVLALMQLLRNQIGNAAAQRAYLRPPVPTAVSS